MQKTCKQCRATKPLEEFYRHMTTKDRRASRCKMCALENNREYVRRPEVRERRTYLAKTRGLEC